MAVTSDAEKAEQLSRRRARTLPVLAVLFLAQQASYFGGNSRAGEGSADQSHVAAWLVLSVVILAVLMTGGGWIYSRNVRRLANDETTRVHRDHAFRAGFIATMAAGVVLYFLSMFEPLSAREAIHVLMSAGIVVTVLWFAFLERRAHGGG